MVVCFLPELVAWWQEKGVETTPLCTVDGVQYYKVDVQDEKMLGDPEYVGLVVRERAKFPEVVKKKFSPPLYYVSLWGEAVNSKDRDGNVAIPVGRDEESVAWLFNTKGDPGLSIECCDTHGSVVRLIREGLDAGATRVMYALSPGYVENFATDNILRVVS
jgi:hypothetical protein